MSLSGLRKQFNKANQYLSETVGAAEATKLDDEFNEFERKIDVTNELVGALIAGTNEYLQPNPATRARMATMGAVSKLRGTARAQPYPQTEGLLSEAMAKYGKALGYESNLGRALNDAAETFRLCADVKYQLEDQVKHNFLDPLTQLQNNELKDVNHHRTKLKGRRLDYDCKKRKGVRDDDMIQAEEKLEESKRLAELAMSNVLANDVEQVSQLAALVDAQLEFHRQTGQLLEQLQTQLRVRIKEAADQQRPTHVPKPVLLGGGSSGRTPRSSSPADLSSQFANSANISAGTATNGSAAAAAQQSSAWTQPSAPAAAATTNSASQQPSCRALFDFEAQNEGELEFKEGNVIELVNQVDENWYEGRLNGRQGFFPISYVQVVVPLRQ